MRVWAFSLMAINPRPFLCFFFFPLPLGKTNCWRIKFGQRESSEADRLEDFFFVPLHIPKDEMRGEEQMDGFQMVPV